MAQTIPFTISALHEILKWSSDRPAWQRDALRRIIALDELAELDMVELDRLCRAAHGADQSTDAAVAPQPLAASHLPPAPGSAASVTLISIGSLQHVNRLPSNQLLSFGTGSGLTVVYGDNGSGKSGYARVIKKACRTRGLPPPIKPNAFAPAPKDAASASITCRVGGTDLSISWKDNISTDPCLANVFVFDASTAGHYLLEDSPAVFTPHGLDVLQKLSKVCDSVSASIQADLDKVDSEIATAVKHWKYPAGTKVATLLGGLSASTKPADVELNAAFTETNATRLTELNEALKSNPKQKASETRASAARIRAFAVKMATSARELTDAQLNALKRTIGEAKDTADAAKAFASGQFDASYLPGTGGTLWRSLFEAAREFSAQEAYRDRDFPVLTEESRCVLCQQSIEGLAADRFRAFDAFCKNQSQQLANQTAGRLADAVKKLRELSVLLSEFTNIKADIATLPEEQRNLIDTFIAKADGTRKSAIESLTQQQWTVADSMPDSPEEILKNYITALEARAAMEESADNPEERAKLNAERDELVAKEWLAGVKDDVAAQIDRYKQVALLKKCQKDAGTRGITEKNSELTEQIVTEAFCKRFKAELKSLGLRTISVKLENIKGRKGETRFGLRLENAADHKIHEVASEGEQRCIALATFLAELSQASHQSSLVFDDPVSSLDHWNRDTIAARLVQESAVRQVIVLTHDAVFLNDLQTHSEKQGSVATYRFLEWQGNTPGQCQDGLPWECKTPEDRLDKLEKKQREIAKNWSPQPNDANKSDMRDAYSWLRATLERIVERVVFADVVFRFRSYVKLKDLKDVVGFSNTECEEILRVHKQCSDVTDAHDPASGKQAPVPDPAQLATDVAATQAVLSGIRLRRKTKLVAKPAAKPAAAP